MEEKKLKSEVNLRKLMQKLGMGTNAFAEACGFSTQSMSQFLRPTKALTTTTIYKIATALDIDPRDMFFPTEEAVNENDNENENRLDDNADANDNQNEAQPVQTVAFCPHCGAKVRVGVVLMQE